MHISIVGTGYVGIVSGACMAEQGHEVHCVDLDQSKVDSINRGVPTCHELGLPELVSRHAGKRLFASRDLARAVQATEVTFIAVGTPARDGRIDLSAVCSAAEQIGAALRSKHTRHTVVVKSTVIPGTTEGVVRDALERASGLVAGVDFGLGMNPEFLTEGTAVRDFMQPDRLVLGGIDTATQDTLARIYAGFAQTPVIRCNSATAEMIKYASNAVLATLISFSNELSRVAARLPGVDIVDVMNGVHAASYFTSRSNPVVAADVTKALNGTTVVAAITSFLEAGCGFGGSCLPKDVTALIAQGESLGVAMPLLKSVLQVNQTQPAQLLALIDKHYSSLSGKRITVLGLAFKPDTDDLRESPAFPLIRSLRKAGAVLTAYDPIARPSNHAELQGVHLAESLHAAVAGADIVILVTRWAQFQNLPQALGARINEVLVVDGRRVLCPSDYSSYEGIGRADRIERQSLIER
jgi:UDPglucose 6-dehydrogenase